MTTIYKTVKALAEETGLCKATIRSRVKELESSGRYSKKAVIEDGNIVLVNAYCFLDWLSVRQSEPNKRQPFNIEEWRSVT